MLSPQLGWFFVCFFFFPFLKPSNIASVCKKDFKTGSARVLAGISCCVGMWTRKHHHCSISLTSRRLILTPQLFPGILTHWHSIYPLWSHTDTNTEPFCERYKGNHSCSEPADSTSLLHTHSRGAPQDQGRRFPDKSHTILRERKGKAWDATPVTKVFYITQLLTSNFMWSIPALASTNSAGVNV